MPTCFMNSFEMVQTNRQTNTCLNRQTDMSVPERILHFGQQCAVKKQERGLLLALKQI